MAVLDDDTGGSSNETPTLSAFSSTAGWFRTGEETREQAEETIAEFDWSRAYAAQQPTGYGFGEGKPGNTLFDYDRDGQSDIEEWWNENTPDIPDPDDTITSAKWLLLIVLVIALLYASGPAFEFASTLADGGGS